MTNVEGQNLTPATSALVLLGAARYYDLMAWVMMLGREGAAMVVSSFPTSFPCSAQHGLSRAAQRGSRTCTLFSRRALLHLITNIWTNGHKI